jgi:hypothetical protein
LVSHRLTIYTQTNYLGFPFSAFPLAIKFGFPSGIANYRAINLIIIYLTSRNFRILLEVP